MLIFETYYGWTQTHWRNQGLMTWYAAVISGNKGGILSFQWADMKNLLLGSLLLFQCLNWKLSLVPPPPPLDWTFRESNRREWIADLISKVKNNFTSTQWKRIPEQTIFQRKGTEIEMETVKMIFATKWDCGPIDGCWVSVSFHASKTLSKVYRYVV